MTFKSYRPQRSKELSDGVLGKMRASAVAAKAAIQAITPVGTPETTGDPNYVVTHALQRSIETGRATTDHVDIGTNKYYGPYVHQGTYDYAHGYRGWSEGEAREADSMFFHNDQRFSGRKGAMPRPFLVNGLLNARPALAAIWHSPIRSASPGSFSPTHGTGSPGRGR